MEEFSQVLSYVAYLLPAIVVGIVSYYFFKGHTANEEGRRRFLLHKESQKHILPIRLQAYERLTLFLERVDPTKLLIRVKPISEDLNNYEELLIKNIEQEFEHNISQQIYISSECWNHIKNAKNATLQVIRESAMNEKVANANKLREMVLTIYMEEITPSQRAMQYLKSEIAELFG